MRRQLDEVALLLKKHNIFVPASARKDDSKEEDEEYQRSFALESQYESSGIQVTSLNLGREHRAHL